MIAADWIKPVIIVVAMAAIGLVVYYLPSATQAPVEQVIEAVVEKETGIALPIATPGSKPA